MVWLLMVLLYKRLWMRKLTNWKLFNPICFCGVTTKDPPIQPWFPTSCRCHWWKQKIIYPRLSLYWVPLTIPCLYRMKIWSTLYLHLCLSVPNCTEMMLRKENNPLAICSVLPIPSPLPCHLKLSKDPDHPTIPPVYNCIMNGTWNNEIPLTPWSWLRERLEPLLRLTWLNRPSTALLKLWKCGGWTVVSWTERKCLNLWNYPRWPLRWDVLLSMSIG